LVFPEAKSIELLVANAKIKKAIFSPFQNTGEMNNCRNVVSFFSGCGGFDLGFKKAGYRIVLANDVWPSAAKTYLLNFPRTKLLLRDIRQIEQSMLDHILKAKKVENVQVIIGGPPCQCFTRMNNNNPHKINDERAQLFKSYIKMVNVVKPDFVVMENVPDLLIRTNGDGCFYQDLIANEFAKAGYRSSYDILEAERYGVPQRRRRAIFLATNRDDVELSFPAPSSKTATVGEFLRKIDGFQKLDNHEFVLNNPEVLERIKHVPPGGYYEQLPEHLKVKKLRDGKWVVAKRYGSYYRRLKNDEPAITITKNYLIHPDEDRYLTNREVALLHTFPLNFKFFGGRKEVAQQIANAVPPKLGERIGKHLLSYF
jgi:DNA (cytosine-5)-methyltransferase 1